MASSYHQNVLTPEITSGSKLPLWLGQEKHEKFPKLTQPIPPVDVCIVGAGLGGLSVAYNCAREGLKVVVIDDGEIGSGESSRTSAHVFSWQDNHMRNIEYLHGPKGAQLAAQSHQEAIDWIERVCREENISCQWYRLDGYLMDVIDKMPGSGKTTISSMLGGGPARDLAKELEASQRAGFRGVETLKRAPIKDFDTGEVIRYPNQAAFQPVMYLNGLAKAAQRHGAQIYTLTKAIDFEGGQQTATVKTTDGIVIEAKHLVMATNTPLNNKLRVHAKVSNSRTYVIAADIPKGSYVDALYWDMEDPYHYVRFQQNEQGPDMIIIGGEDHLVGKMDKPAEERYKSLEKWARNFWPQMGQVKYAWSGQIVEPVDALAYIGRNPGDYKNVYIITGDSGNGITHTTIAGMLLRDIILGRPNEWETLYDPSRISMLSMGEMLVHDVDINMQYKDYLLPGDIKDIEDLQKGCGGILRRGLQKYAVYRDETGQIFECHATCPHLGGSVRWNPDEKTFDCPVHGSRFDHMGHVINGPSKSDLVPTDERAESSKK